MEISLNNSTNDSSPENKSNENNIIRAASKLRQEIKKLSHNELSRQYVYVYQSLILANKDLTELKDMLKNVEALEHLLKKAKELQAGEPSSEALPNDQNLKTEQLTTNKLNSEKE